GLCANHFLVVESLPYTSLRRAHNCRVLRKCVPGLARSLQVLADPCRKTVLLYAMLVNGSALPSRCFAARNKVEQGHRAFPNALVNFDRIVDLSSTNCT